MRIQYRFKATKQFWKAFHGLPIAQKALAREKFKVFKDDPYHPSLKAHKIQKLSVAYKKRIMSVAIEGDLRAVFFQEGDVIFTVDIGNHTIYR